MNRDPQFVAYQTTLALEGLIDSLSKAIDNLEVAEFQATNLPETHEAKTLRNQIALLGNMKANLKSYKSDANEVWQLSENIYMDSQAPEA